MIEWPNIEQAAVSTLVASLLLAKNTDELVSEDMVSTGTGVVGADDIRKERTHCVECSKNGPPTLGYSQRM